MLRARQTRPLRGCTACRLAAAAADVRPSGASSGPARSAPRLQDWRALPHFDIAWL